jgi:hypothetical protein
VVTGQMSPANLACGEAGEGARRGHRPKTRMAVSSPTRIPIGLGHVVREATGRPRPRRGAPFPRTPITTNTWTAPYSSMPMQLSKPLRSDCRSIRPVRSMFRPAMRNGYGRGVGSPTGPISSSMSGVWRRGMVEMVGHPQTKGCLASAGNGETPRPSYTTTREGFLRCESPARTTRPLRRSPSSGVI